MPKLLAALLVPLAHTLGAVAPIANAPVLPLDSAKVLSERVALRTPQLGGVLRGDANASARVFAGRDGFKVRGIHARPIAAQMVNLQPIGDRADVQLVGESVGAMLHTLDLEVSVAAIQAQLPFPTLSAGVDAVGGGEPLEGRQASVWHSGNHSHTHTVFQV